MQTNSDYRTKVLHHYNRAANIYDLFEFIRHGTRKKVVDLSGWQPGETVLDVCTGTGELAFTFARLGAQVVGIDIAINMLNRAIDKTIGTQPTWQEMDATELQFEENSFDISTLSLALHHMPENIQHHVLSEMARVTRRCVILIEPHTPYNDRLKTFWGAMASVIDESEYMPQWAKQDFNQTCQQAGLKVENQLITTLYIHRITRCRPMINGDNHKTPCQTHLPKI